MLPIIGEFLRLFPEITVKLLQSDRNVDLVDAYADLAVAAADAAIAGVGATLLLEHDVAEALSAGKLKIVLKEFEVSAVPVHLIHVSRNLMPLKLRRFIEFAAPRLRQSLSGFGKR